MRRKRNRTQGWNGDDGETRCDPGAGLAQAGGTAPHSHQGAGTHAGKRDHPVWVAAVQDPCIQITSDISQLLLQTGTLHFQGGPDITIQGNKPPPSPVRAETHLPKTANESGSMNQHTPKDEADVTSPDTNRHTPDPTYTGGQPMAGPSKHH
ncbi:hypothetical protein EOD39_12746 [Acipenser ruthenus]|uniref:Uncharacterized protein n=1 Tax=Acipenser ruthenus TaxID=7906 RepID=A0A662YQD5_ACIRT|nr:hypothetical protein EOD39_12746 [Acipenser ruthenus]